MNMLDTSDDQAPLFSFAVVTDTHLSVEADGAAVDERAPNNLTYAYRRALERINEMGPAFVVHLGDMADPPGSLFGCQAGLREQPSAMKRADPPQTHRDGAEDIRQVSNTRHAQFWH